jgi:hypothetical protein
MWGLPLRQQGLQLTLPCQLLACSSQSAPTWSRCRGMTQCHIARRDPRRHLSFCIQRGLRPRQPALTGNGGTTMWPRKPKGSPNQAVVKESSPPSSGPKAKSPTRRPPPDRRRSRSPAMRQRWLTMFEIDLDIGAFSPCPLHTTGQIQMNFFDWDAARKALIALIADKKSVREIAENSARRRDRLRAICTGTPI